MKKYVKIAIALVGGFAVAMLAMTIAIFTGYTQAYNTGIETSIVKVMLVIGTKPEYYSAVWVKNEWSRFLQLMKSNRSKLLIPCYRDMDAYALPDEFAHLQAQDMSKIGFINDVVRGIKKVVRIDTPTAQTVVVNTKIPQVTNSISPLLKRIALFLEDEEFDKADDYCERVLNVDPENADASWLGMRDSLLAFCKAKNKKTRVMLCKILRSVAKNSSLNCFLNAFSSNLSLAIW